MTLLNLTLIKRRLGQYGLAWMLLYGLVLVSALIATYLGDRAYIEVADILLKVAFWAVGGVLALFAISSVLQKETVLTHASLWVLALILTLPLFWAPVLGVVTGAWVAHVSIEYSSVYAGFRILVGRLIFGVTETILGSPMVDAGWAFMQVFAGVVGFVSAVGHVWTTIQRLGHTPVHEPAGS